MEGAITVSAGKEFQIIKSAKRRRYSRVCIDSEVRGVQDMGDESIQGCVV